MYLEEQKWSQAENKINKVHRKTNVKILEARD